MKTRAKTVSSARPISQPRRSAEAPPTETFPEAEMGLRVGFEHILVPFDFSKPAEAALRYALTFAKQFNATVTLLYVIEPPAFSDFEANPLVVDDDAAVEKVKRRLTSVRLKLGENGARISDVKVLIGKPFHAITSLANWQKMDLIIISTHGRTALKHVLLGSTAEKVVRHAHCPVLVVR